MATVTTSDIIQCESTPDRTSVLDENRRQIKAINRQNLRVDWFVKCLAIFLMAAVAASFVYLVGYGLYEVAQNVASWNIQDLGRIAVGY